MIRRPPRSTRTDTLFPYTTLFRSVPFYAILTHAAESCFKWANETNALDGWKIKFVTYDDGYEPARSVAVTRRLVEEDKIRSEEHTSELQSLMRISYAVFCLKKKKKE